MGIKERLCRKYQSILCPVAEHGSSLENDITIRFPISAISDDSVAIEVH